MKLSQIINNCNLELKQGSKDIDVTGITINSKQVEPGNMFVAYKGFNIDSHQYIKEAIEKGATVICVEKVPENIPENVTVIQSKDIRKNLSLMASNFYDNPSKELKMIAVTGTKGKTTTVKMISEILKNAGYNVGTIGSLGIHYNDTDINVINTTPDGLILQKSLREMANNGVDTVIIENSSQAFKLDRTAGIQYDYGILLNIDRDHIGKNEHSSFEDYVECKLKLLEQSDNIIINHSDKIWDYFKLHNYPNPITFSQYDQSTDYFLDNFEPYTKNGILGSKFSLNGKEDKIIELSMPGQCNADNALAAIAVCDNLGIDFKIIQETLKNIGIKSRTEILPEGLEKGLTVILDSAHNRLSAESLLEGLHEYNPKRIICLFGVDKAETKLRRFDLGYASGKYADYSILTSGNSDNDNFEENNLEVIQGLKESGGDYTVIPDRKEAYRKSLSMMDKDDFLVLMNLFVFHSGNEE